MQMITQNVLIFFQVIQALIKLGRSFLKVVSFMWDVPILVLNLNKNEA